jgi:hypothetical protein
VPWDAQRAVVQLAALWKMALVDVEHKLHRNLGDMASLLLSGVHTPGTLIRIERSNALLDFCIADTFADTSTAFDLQLNPANLIQLPQA